VSELLIDVAERTAQLDRKPSNFVHVHRDGLITTSQIAFSIAAMPVRGEYTSSGDLKNHDAGSVALCRKASNLQIVQCWFDKLAANHL